MLVHPLTLKGPVKTCKTLILNNHRHHKYTKTYVISLKMSLFAQKFMNKISFYISPMSALFSLGSIQLMDKDQNMMCSHHFNQSTLDRCNTSFSTCIECGASVISSKHSSTSPSPIAVIIFSFLLPGKNTFKIKFSFL